MVHNSVMKSRATYLRYPMIVVLIVQTLPPLTHYADAISFLPPTGHDILVSLVLLGCLICWSWSWLQWCPCSSMARAIPMQLEHVQFWFRRGVDLSLSLQPSEFHNCNQFGCKDVLQHVLYSLKFYTDREYETFVWKKIRACSTTQKWQCIGEL